MDGIVAEDDVMVKIGHRQVQPIISIPSAVSSGSVLFNCGMRQVSWRMSSGMQKWVLKFLMK